MTRADNAGAKGRIMTDIASKIPSPLQRLANVFAPRATLYAVGGFVRDSLLDINCYDIDVCSKLTVDKVKELLCDTEFVVSDKNLRVGTVHISTSGFTVEYTTFRTDSYPENSGAHDPSVVVFTDDITLDAKRRDFKCNAVYYDVAADRIVDPLGGVADIENRVLSVADEGVFEADGLRVLRLIRFMAELGFGIEEGTLRSAKENAWRVKDIAVERIREELNGIFTAELKHPALCVRDGHIRGFRLLDELGLVDLLLPELAELKGLPQPKQYHLYDAYEHSIKAFELSPPSLRWAALLHDVGKAEAVRIGGNMHGHDALGEATTRKILARLRFKNADISRISRLVGRHMVDINGNTSVAKLRRFAIENIDIIDDLCSLIDIDALASAGEITRTNRLREAYKQLVADGVPQKIKDLKVSGADLVEMGVDEKYRGAILKDLLYDTAMDPQLNDREKALSYVYNAAKRMAKEQKG